MKPLFDEVGLLSDSDPAVAIERYSAPTVNKLALSTLRTDESFRNLWIEDWQTTESIKLYLRSRQNYELLVGQQVNLYKPFIQKSWHIQQQDGVYGSAPS